MDTCVTLLPGTYCMHTWILIYSAVDFSLTFCTLPRYVFKPWGESPLRLQIGVYVEILHVQWTSLLDGECCTGIIVCKPIEESRWFKYIEQLKNLGENRNQRPTEHWISVVQIHTRRCDRTKLWMSRGKHKDPRMHIYNTCRRRMVQIFMYYVGVMRRSETAQVLHRKRVKHLKTRAK